MQTIKQSKFTKDAIIIRMHSVAIEKDIIDVGVSQFPRPKDKKSLIGELELLGIVLTLYKAYQKA